VKIRTPLSPREAPAEPEDLAARRRLIGRQRVARQRRRRPAARRTRRAATVLGVAGVAVGVVVLTALAGRWLTTSPRFAVTRVEVSGHSRLNAEEILTAAGIAPGTNLFRLDPTAVAGRVEAIPGIRRAEVIRRLPDHVTLIVQERRPFTLAHAGRLHWIDEQGVSLGLEANAVALSAPVISGLGPEDVEIGPGGRSPRAETGVALARLLLRSGGGLLAHISEIDVSRAEGPVLYTLGGIEVRLGREDWPARLGRLQGVLAQLEVSGESVGSIDLRFRDQVVLNTAMK